MSVLCDCTSGLIGRLCGSCSKAAHLAEVAPANHLQDVEVFSLKTSLLHLLYQRFSCDWRKVHNPSIICGISTSIPALIVYYQLV